MDNRAVILHCLYENWPDDVSMIGDDWVARIINDALSGNRTKFQPALGGYNFDLAPYIDTIIAGASLLVSLVQFYMQYVRDNPDRSEEDLVKILVQYLTEAMKMERGKATKLTRVFIRIIRSDGS